MEKSNGKQSNCDEINSFLNSICRLNEWEKGGEFVAKINRTPGIDFH